MEFVTGYTSMTTFGVFLQLVTLAITFLGSYYVAARQMQITEINELGTILKR
jgi:hypothetical protein